ncbi:hypothetical protein PWG71_27070 [Nocardiopsis sp. N85]|uniref:hypothetical protein n=1 Tax=Nocardiopsis sp. N85 TaxID=3029400 RepID=UPI00237FB741|nr:hypothetical protein [Nocardiopsis sp. N85]MDE3725060.1 hypothetical protein [Nocardiopsis sp. N85]
MRIPRALLAVVLLTIVGCSITEAEEEAPEVGERVGDLWVPLDDYGFSRLDMLTVQYAEDLLIGDCLNAVGLEWDPLPSPPEQDTDPLNRRRYGLVEPELAELYGYHLPPPTEDQRERDRVWQAREVLPRAEWVAAYGEDGDGGCLSEARERLYRDVPAIDTTLLNGHIGQTFEASQEHPEVVSAFGEWRTCMLAKGFDYAAPLDVHADPAWTDSAEPSPREITVAGTDVRCKEETGLVKVWSAVEEEIQSEVIDSHPEDFALFARAKEAEMEAARSVIEQSGAVGSAQD